MDMKKHRNKAELKEGKNTTLHLLRMNYPELNVDDVCKIFHN